MVTVTPIDQITVEDLTTQSINGSGVFDKLMSAMNLHLLEELNSGRINTNEYSKMYTQLTIAVMGNSIQFLLGKDQSYLTAKKLEAEITEIVPKQIELLSEQVEVQRAETLDTRTDGVTPITGNIGTKKALLVAQREAYTVDAQYKYAKNMTDIWATSKVIDEGLTVPPELDNTSIGEVFTTLRDNLGL